MIVRSELQNHRLLPLMMMEAARAAVSMAKEQAN